MDDYKTLQNLHEFEWAAEKQLPKMAYDYYAGGAGDEVTLRGTRAAWDAISLRYRVLRDVSKRTLNTQLLGSDLGFPLLVAPMAFQRMAHPEGEAATARAADNAGVGMILSTLATSSIEEIRGATKGPLWFQLYIYRDRGASKALVERAERAGCTALVLTVDSPLLGRRERDMRNRFHVNADLTVPNLTGDPRAALAAGGDPHRGDGSALSAFVQAHWDSSISWKDVEWLRSVTKLPILVKGIVRGDDAELALQHGAAGVIVSNHGGRQLDTSLATPSALPEVAYAMGGRGTILVDGGIRRGTDVIKALALGANAVLLGRPILWGLALGGQAGVARVLELLREETDLALALAGARSPAEVTADLIA